ncbi:hypothetical protein FLK61_38875 [Paenalkalicoccus suaedae]|uniref:Uncharacterized protein n=1 Tax=Paenalkalicoccus suaedae TaxID=2592382 RepID=A0A859FIK8_9BACI|nr:hypothetical protein [Paenalkalicoccus suaedae]QKS72584.1 hypothetical protein FLK61_38875 [Paenalkalicoccus suaedae]
MPNTTTKGSNHLLKKYWKSYLGIHLLVVVPAFAVYMNTDSRYLGFIFPIALVLFPIIFITYATRKENRA